MADNITDRYELQWRLVYAIIVAGKSAAFATNAMAKLFPRRSDGLRYPTPFDTARTWLLKDNFRDRIVKARTGNYRKLERAVRWLVVADTLGELSLENATAADLERCPGIGPKTSRFFILWTRPSARHAALDVHVLRWLRNNGHPDAPLSTPQSKAKYGHWERVFIDAADRLGVTPAQLDAAVWDQGANG